MTWMQPSAPQSVRRAETLAKGRVSFVEDLLFSSLGSSLPLYVMSVDVAFVCVCNPLIMFESSDLAYKYVCIKLSSLHVYQTIQIISVFLSALIILIYPVCAYMYIIHILCFCKQDDANPTLIPYCICHWDLNCVSLFNPNCMCFCEP